MVSHKRTTWIGLLGLEALLIYRNCYHLKLPKPKSSKLPESIMKGKSTFGYRKNGEN
ncbi:MAG: hypothetical protein ACI9DJ_003280 [Algoriphagus sp.]|jgi:hypothetical protein